MSDMIYRFGSFELDDALGELRRGSEPVSIQPKPLALLSMLVRDRDRVVSLDELFEALWPGTAVTPGSLTRAVSHARRAVDDTNRGELIRSYARRGYRFCGEVIEVGGPPEVGATPPTARPAPRSAPAPTNPARDTPFVGRREALDGLRTAWDSAAGGRTMLALVNGAAGIGKTRLVEVFSEEVAARGPLVVEARARDGAGVPAFWLWAQVLRQLLAEPYLREHGREMAVHPDELAHLVPDLEPADSVDVPADLSADQRRFLLFDAVSRTVARCSRERPLVLVLEDLQWAGSASLRLLEHLVFETRDAPILVVGTVRDEMRERGHPLNRTLSVVRQLDRCARVELAGFSRGEVRDLLAQVLGAAAPSDLTSELYVRTEGVPLFVREAIRLLRDRGELRQPERIPQRGIELPQQAVDLIRRSLDSLPAACAEVVSVAAVIGREFSVPLVARVAKIDRGEALDRLDEAVEAGVVQHAAGSAATYRFTHALFQEATYEALPTGARARLHARVAEHLEQQHADDPDRVIAELAHHHLRGIAVGDPDRAYECAVRAAAQAGAMRAYEQEAIHHEQALAALDQTASVDANHRLETLLALGEAHRNAGERDRSREILAEAIATARSLDRSTDFARAAISFCDISLWYPQDTDAEPVLKEALAKLGDVEQKEAKRLRARLLTRVAFLAHAEDRAFDEKQSGGAERASLMALDNAREVDDGEAIQEAAYMRHYQLAGPESLEQRVELVEETVAASRRSTVQDVTLIALLDIACDRLAVGDPVGAKKYRDQATRLFGEVPSAVGTWHQRVYDTGIALMEGRWDEAHQLSRDALSVGQRIQHPYSVACYNSHRVGTAWEQGDYASVVRIYEPAMRANYGPAEWVTATVARSKLAMGQEEAARVLFESLAQRDFSDVQRGIRFIRTIHEIALLCAELEDEARAPILIDELSRLEHFHGVVPIPICYSGPFAWTLGRLNAVMGKGDEALQLYEEAADAAEVLGARPTLARVQLDLAALLERRREPARANELVAQALATAEALSMAHVADRARALQQRWEGAR